MRLDPHVLDAMRRYKALEGVPVVTQIEKAVTEWLAKRGIVVQKRTSGTRKRTRRS
ncbi:MAG TPA: hypothetical protein VFA27_13125 [Vicinamibacterales bacterium]|nr:hypothetical protein [Vicinamibacterales bacterium]